MRSKLVPATHGLEFRVAVAPGPSISQIVVYMHVAIFSVLPPEVSDISPGDT
jgi:hypothetical protein